MYLTVKCWLLGHQSDTIISECELNRNNCVAKLISNDPLKYQLSYRGQYLKLLTSKNQKYLPMHDIQIPSGIVHINDIHTKFGHINAKYLIKSAREGTTTGITDGEIEELKRYAFDKDCEACLLGKARRSNAVEGSKDSYIHESPFNVVYTDICQVEEADNPSRPSYFISFNCALTKFYTRWS